MTRCQVWHSDRQNQKACVIGQRYVQLRQYNFEVYHNRFGGMRARGGSNRGRGALISFGVGYSWAAAVLVWQPQLMQKPSTLLQH